MKLSLILCVLALTAGVFFAATQTIRTGQTTAAATQQGLASEAAELTSALEEQTSQLGTLQSERDQLTSELESTRTLLAVATAENAELLAKGTAEEAEAAIASLTGEIEDLQTQNRALEDSAASAAAQIAAAEASSAEKTEALTRSEAEVAQLIEETEQQAALISERTDQIAELTGMIETANTAAALTCQEQSDALLAQQAISFDPGTTTLSDSSIATLEELAPLAADCIRQGLRLQIEGHTDNTGGAASNLLLSNGRAAAVSAFLQDQGIAPDAMRAVGFGASDPIASSGSEADPSLNQRIHLSWLPL